MIHHILEINETIKVYYSNGRVRTFGKNDSLPMTVLDKYLNGNATTEYTNTGKVTRIY